MTARLFCPATASIYGIPSDDFFASDVPHVLAVDLGTGQTVADVSIPGLTDGQPRPTSTSATAGPYRQDAAGLAWDLRRARLYILHPDADRISVVDLQHGVLATQATIQRKLGLLDRLLGWLVVPAEAKLNPGLIRRAVVSPDGSRLYVTGVRNEVESKNGNMDWEEVPLGLRVIRLDSFTEERHLDLPVIGADATNLAGVREGVHHRGFWPERASLPQPLGGHPPSVHRAGRAHAATGRRA